MEKKLLDSIKILGQEENLGHQIRILPQDTLGKSSQNKDIGPESAIRISKDELGSWFRLKNLFTDFLTKEAEQQDPELLVARDMLDSTASLRDHLIASYVFRNHSDLMKLSGGETDSGSFRRFVEQAKNWRKEEKIVKKNAWKLHKRIHDSGRIDSVGIDVLITKKDRIVTSLRPNNGESPRYSYLILSSACGELAADVRRRGDYFHYDHSDPYILLTKIAKDFGYRTVSYEAGEGKKSDRAWLAAASLGLMDSERDIYDIPTKFI